MCCLLYSDFATDCFPAAMDSATLPCMTGSAMLHDRIAVLKHCWQLTCKASMQHLVHLDACMPGLPACQVCVKCMTCLMLHSALDVMLITLCSDLLYILPPLPNY